MKILEAKNSCVPAIISLSYNAESWSLERENLAFVTNAEKNSAILQAVRVNDTGSAQLLETVHCWVEKGGERASLASIYRPTSPHYFTTVYHELNLGCARENIDGEWRSRAKSTLSFMHSCLCGTVASIQKEQTDGKLDLDFVTCMASLRVRPLFWH